jgi:beta-glucanase (GH16 family)
MKRMATIIYATGLWSCGGGSGGLIATEPKAPPVVVQAKWELLWADEFTGATLDAASWIAVDGASNVNNELQYYTPSDVYLEDGSLVLRSQRRTMGGRAYTSGEVRTGTKHTVRTGNAVEWRTQSPSGKGIWPANWLVGTQCDGINGCGANWPPEIDVMELRGSLPNDNLMTHWWGTWPNVQHQTTTYSGTTLSVGYHTYRVEWFPDSVLWYVDGTQRAKHTSNITAGVLQLVMNTAVGGDFDGNPLPATVFPQYHRIDYVRVYRDTANVY